VKLRQQKNPINVRIDAVADRNVDETVLAGERHSRFATFHRKGVKPRTATTAHDDCENFLPDRHKNMKE
jgi:hypothetical protein